MAFYFINLYLTDLFMSYFCSSLVNEMVWVI